MGAQKRRLAKQRHSLAMKEEARSLVSQMHADSDEYVEIHLLPRLAQEGIVLSCKPGCGACCHQEILLPRPEAECLVEYLRDHLTSEEMEKLKERLVSWLRWVRHELPRHLAINPDLDEAFYEEGPDCPLLIDGRCSGYLARPLTCRSHYVSTPPAMCLRDKDEGHVPGKVKVIDDVSKQGFGIRLNDYMLNHGQHIALSLHRLPEWLSHLLGLEREPWISTPKHRYSDFAKGRRLTGT